VPWDSGSPSHIIDLVTRVWVLQEEQVGERVQRGSLGRPSDERRDELCLGRTTVWQLHSEVMAERSELRNVAQALELVA
jgi:hypothetical protein